MKKIVSVLCVVGLTISAALSQQKGQVEIDVQHYKIDAELLPAEQKLRAVAEVTFIPQAETRSVVFEMNGSLTIAKVTLKSSLPTSAPPATTPPKPISTTTATPPTLARQAQTTRPGQKPATTPVQKPTTPTSKSAPPAVPVAAPISTLQFVQDNRENMNVRVDLGSVVPAKQPITIIFEYEGALESPQGGPLQNARLAYVGNQGSYLFYAARWFPFHEYAADRSTYQISLTVPKEMTAVGYSEQPVVATPAANNKMIYSFVSTKPALPGNYAVAQYIAKPYSFGGLTVDVYAKVGDEKSADHLAQIAGKHLEYYSSKFGTYAFGDRFIIAEVDEETLETYSGAGILFLNPKAFATGNEELLARETAYQWWGQTVGIKSFDDAWLMQGLAQFSGLLYLKDNSNESTFQQAMQAELEKGLAFEQSASIRNAPKQLDDQSSAFRSVVYYKGAVVFNMLRQLMGEQNFDGFIKNYYAQNAGKNLSIDDFETVASKAAGRNLRSFFGQWVDSTGVPEFRADWRMLRLKDGFRVPGTVKQEIEAFEMPIEVVLKTEAGAEKQELVMKGTSADFDIITKSKPLDIIIDPDSKLMRNSDELRQSVVVRRGIEHVKEMEYLEAEQQFNAAIKLNRGNSWAWYNLGLLCMLQRNYQKALDSFDQALNGNLRPDWVEVWSYIYRGNAWDAIDQRERAIAEYNKAISNGSNYDNAQAVAQKYIEQKFDPKNQKSIASN
ncbi:MAG: tetratricopeptide repeat protein [Blastocatellia bacterium]|nr:tetratricopeptide repeat protein [Blastocatellia bacterium]